MGNHTAAQAQATSARRSASKGASGGGGGKATPKPKPSPPKPKARPGPAPDATKAARDAADRAVWRSYVSDMRNPAASARYAQSMPTTPRAALAGAASDDQRVSLREAARALTASRRWVGERALAIGADGRVLTATAKGVVKHFGYEEVNLPHSDWATVRADPAAAYLHTHPFGSFSRGDLMSFAEHALGSMHATGPGPDGKTWMFSLFQGRNPGSTNGRLTTSVARRIGLSHAYTTIWRQVDREYTNAIHAGRMTDLEANALQAHTVMQRLAAQVGPDYLIYEAGPLD